MEEFTFLSNWLLWLIAAAILVIVELLTNTFAAFCLVGGCALALATSLIGFGIEAQLTAAAIGSVLSFIAFKPLIRRQAEARRHRDCLSNMDALIGRTTTVTGAIPPDVCASTATTGRLSAPTRRQSTSGQRCV